MTLPTISTCDVCKGPAWWCLDRFGEVWILCQDDGCSFRLQAEMFPEEPLWEERVLTPVRGHEVDDTKSEVTDPDVPDLPF